MGRVQWRSTGARTGTEFFDACEYLMPRFTPCLIAPLLFLSLPLAHAAEPSPDSTQQIAFPSAEGFGRFARGGRGGDVYHVTNLQDDGPGSLREGIRTANGPRSIVFDVSGTISLKTPLLIDKSFLTIAGQTAPGDGICLKDQTFRIRRASHVIVRYIRVRLGDENKPRPSGPDCINTDDVDHVIFDHVTASWGIDGNHDLRRGGNFTLQWSIYAEALNNSLHEDGSHAMLASFRDLTASISLHHNLFASSRERHPTLGGSRKTRPEAIADFRNNVIYNLSGATNLGNCRINAISNYYRPGPDTVPGRRPFAVKTENAGALQVFMSGNLFEGSPEFDNRDFSAIDFERWSKGGYLATSLEQIRSASEFDVGNAAPHTDSAGNAYERVLKLAGASRRRDAADQRLVAGVKDRTHRLIDSQRQVGGWPRLHSEPAPLDTDRDGMPDDWEQQHTLNPSKPDDRNGDRNNDGFTNLEEYLNSLTVSHD
ncbi:MAG: polysaccharide lyase family 1 protein [Planctomycetaceae bacterium]